MKRFLVSVVFVLLSSMLVFSQPPSESDAHKDAQQQIRDIISLVKQQQPTPADPKIQWNRYETKNFEILSIDDAQGKFLYENVENIKTWVYLRWGMKDIDFNGKCKIMVVPTTDLYTKLFGKTQSTWRVDANGSNIWLISEERWSTGTLAPLMSEVCLTQFEIFYNVKFGVWAHRGMSVLNGNLKLLGQQMGTCQFTYDAKSFFGMTADNYIKLDAAAKAKFDSQAAAFCLMVRKEMGGTLILDFMDKERSGVDSALSVLRLRTQEELDAALNGYMIVLGREIQGGRVPLTYLTW